MSRAPVKESERSIMLDRKSPYRTYVRALNTKVRTGGSLSGRERNCAFLNLGGEGFAPIGAVTGFDVPDDSRAIAVCDWDLDGQLDFWLSARTAPRLRFFRNELASTGNWLLLRLEGGVRANRDAIGARVTLTMPDGSTAMRTLRAGEGYLGQSTKWLHFGLGDHREVTAATVRWPGGATTKLGPLDANQRYLAKEAGGVKVWPGPVPNPQLAAPAGEALQPVTGSESALVSLVYPLPLPELGMTDATGAPLPLRPAESQGYTLLNVWRHDCAPCVAEMQDFSEHAAALRAQNISVLCLHAGNTANDRTKAEGLSRKHRDTLRFAFAETWSLDILHVLLKSMFDVHPDLPLPTSLLVGPDQRVVAVYTGAVSSKRLLADAAWNSSARHSIADRLQRQLGGEGQWIAPAGGTDVFFIPLELMTMGRVQEAASYVRKWSDLFAHHEEFGRLLVWIGDEKNKRGEARDAMVFYLNALRRGASDHLVMNNVAWQMAANPDPQIRNGAEAVKWASKAVTLTGGQNPAYLDTLAAAQAEAGDFKSAIATAQRAMTLARAQNQFALLPGLQKALRLYESGQPFRD